MGQSTSGLRSSVNIPAADIEILNLIGKGGMGTVYLSRWLGMETAVKVVTDPMRQEDLLREADILSHLRHPCVCTTRLPRDGVTAPRGLPRPAATVTITL